MRRGVEALEGSNPRDQLTWFVLRFIAKLSPCTETLISAYVSSGEFTSEVGPTASTSHTRELICNALLKLKELAFIEFAAEQIAITEEGRRFLDESPVVALRQHENRVAETGETKSDNEVTTENRESDFMESTAEVAETPHVSSQPPLQTRIWTRMATLLAAYGPQLNKFCRDRLTGTRAATRLFKMNGGKIQDISLQMWKRKVAPMIWSGEATLVRMLARLARVWRSRAEASAIVLGNWRSQVGAMLSRAAKASGLPPNAELAGFDLSPWVIFAGALLLVCSALAIAGGVVFLSDKRTEVSPARGVAFLSGNRAESSRGSPIVWLFDRQDRPGRSIFVTRKLAGVTWIEGFAIRGENASNQTLTAVQGAIKTDSGEEIKLSMAESQGKQVDAQDVPSGSKFTLECALHPDTAGQQTGMPAEEFLSKYGGMIFRFSFTAAGIQTTLIEYFSTSKLRAQLADIESAERSQ